MNTNKITEPINNAKLTIFNGISDLNEINIYSDEFLLYENLQSNNPTKDYIKFPVLSSGYLSIWNADNTFRLMNLPLDLEKDKYYTLILSGTSDEPEFILLEDFSEFSLNSGYIRLINITDDNILIVENKETYTSTFLLKKMQHSQNLEYSDDYSHIECYVNENFLFRFDDIIRSGELNTLIISKLYSEPYYYVINRNYPF